MEYDQTSIYNSALLIWVGWIIIWAFRRVLAVSEIQYFGYLNERVNNKVTAGWLDFSQEG